MLGLPPILSVASFRRVWFAGLASNAGSWFQATAAGWLVYHYTQSPAVVGALSLVARLPAIVFSTVAGHLADRFDRRHVGIATGIGQGLAALALAVAGLFGVQSTLFIFIATFFVGLGFALGLPAMLALIGELPGRDRLPEAIRVNAAGINVARMIGPVMGGGVLLVFGPTTCFALNAVSFLGLVVVLARLPPMPRSGNHTVATTRDALRYAVTDPAPRRLLSGASIFCVSHPSSVGTVVAGQDIYFSCSLQYNNSVVRKTSIRWTDYLNIMTVDHTTSNCSETRSPITCIISQLRVVATSPRVPPYTFTV